MKLPRKPPPVLWLIVGCVPALLLIVGIEDDAARVGQVLVMAIAFLMAGAGFKERDNGRP